MKWKYTRINIYQLFFHFIEFKRTTEPTKLTTTITKTTNILIYSKINSLHSVEIAPLEKEDKLEQTNKKQKTVSNPEKLMFLIISVFYVFIVCF